MIFYHTDVFLHVLLHFVHLTDWDATGKPGAGLYSGNLVWLGNYDECQAQDEGLYCLANIRVPAGNLLNQSTSNQVCSTFL